MYWQLGTILAHLAFGPVSLRHHFASSVIVLKYLCDCKNFSVVYWYDHVVVSSSSVDTFCLHNNFSLQNQIL